MRTTLILALCMHFGDACSATCSTDHWWENARGDGTPCKCSQATVPSSLGCAPRCDSRAVAIVEIVHECVREGVPLCTADGAALELLGRYWQARANQSSLADINCTHANLLGKSWRTGKSKNRLQRACSHARDLLSKLHLNETWTQYVSDTLTCDERRRIRSQEAALLRLLRLGLLAAQARSGG